MNAAGQFIPPEIIFPRKRRNDFLFQGVPYGTLCLQNESGYQKSCTFLAFLEHFQKNVHSTVDDRVILLIDGHSSHKSIEAIEFCRANGIILISFPPHCTHEMQPLDVGVFSAFQCYYNEELNLWLKSNPGKIVSLYNVALLFGRAYRRVATMNNAINAFEKTGIWPLNPNIFPDWKFKSALTTERPLGHTPSLENPGTSSTGDAIITENHQKTKKKPKPRNSSSESSSDVWEASGRSSDDISLFGDHFSSGEEHDSSFTQKDLAPDSSQTSKKIISPFDIKPPPTAPPETRSSRGSHGAIELTSSPNYKVIKEKVNVKPPKKKTKQVRKRLFKNKDVDGKSNDASCLFCAELFSESVSREKWIQCVSCKEWAHVLCAGISAKQKMYICDVNCNGN